MHQCLWLLTYLSIMLIRTQLPPSPDECALRNRSLLGMFLFCHTNALYLILFSMQESLRY